MRSVYSTPTEMQAAFKRASPAEREQILAFIRVNARPKGQCWFLTQYQDLDTGRKRLTAAFTLDKKLPWGNKGGPGLSGTLMRQAFNLPAWQGNVSNYPCPKMVKAQSGKVLTSDYKLRPSTEYKAVVGGSSLGKISKQPNKTATPKGGRAITLRRKK